MPLTAEQRRTVERLMPEIQRIGRAAYSGDMDAISNGLLTLCEVVESGEYAAEDPHLMRRVRDRWKNLNREAKAWTKKHITGLTIRKDVCDPRLWVHASAEIDDLLSILDEEEADILRMYADRVPLKSIAREKGYSLPTIVNRLRRIKRAIIREVES